MSFFLEHRLIYSCKFCFSLNILCYINRKVNKLMSHDSSSDIFSDSWLWLWGINMLSTLQFQSAHSAGSTYWSTAVCALQVLLVYPSLLISQFTHEDGILVGLQQVLLVCSQLLPVCAVQIHAKLSVSQAGSQKKRGVHVKLFKKAFSLQTAEQMSPPTPQPACWRHVEATQRSFFESPVCLAVFRWMTSQFRYLTKWKEIAQYPSAIRQMLRATAQSSAYFMHGSVRLNELGRATAPRCRLMLSEH